MSTPWPSLWSRPGEADDDGASSADLPAVSATAHLRPPLPPAALHGLAGDVALAFSKEAGADPAGILLLFPTMLANAVGPEPHVVFGFDRQSARLFVLIVGDAATGGKGTIFTTVERLFAEADPQWFSQRILTGIQSPEAMIDQVADSPNGDCRLLIVETEFAWAGITNGCQRNGVQRPAPQRLRRSSTRDHPNQLEKWRPRDLVRAAHAHISLIGQITPQELLSLQGKLRASGGLETRLLFALVVRQADTNPFTPPRAPSARVS